MRVLIERYVPYLVGVVEPYAEVEYLEPEEFTPDRVRDADALIIRTRTRCDEALLGGSRVRLIATATIGYDHIDRNYCDTHGIVWRNAPGCNAAAVAQYVEEALDETYDGMPQRRTIGVVGVGHVGSLVVEMARRKGYTVLQNDPPRGIGVSLEEIARQSDVVTFHTPLTREGAYPTYHLCDEAFLGQCRPGALIINAARGGVVDEQALLRSGHPYVIDCWEGEPNLQPEVLAAARLATLHIAGYSIQGKINGSNACLRALHEVLGLPLLTIDATQLPLPGDSKPGWLRRITESLKAHPEQFEQLRKAYKLR